MLFEVLVDFAGERFFDTMTMESLGWVSAQRMRQLCRERLARYPTNLWPLWTTFAVELWFREMFALHPVHCDQLAFPTPASGVPDDQLLEATSLLSE